MLVGAAAYWILALDARRSILFGALPIVTGPTVVLPLLRHVQPVGSVRSILKWEGILDDPVGAIIAVLIIGAPRRARAGGEALHAHGGDVVLADTNRANVSRARMAGLRTCSDNVLSDYALEDLDLGGVGRVLALTSNDEANSLAALHFAEVFGGQETYQLAAASESQRDAASDSHPRGRVAFGPDVTFSALADRFFEGAVVKVKRLTEDFDHDSVRELHGDSLVPLFAFTEKGGLRIFTADAKPTLDSGSTLVCLVDELEPMARTAVD